MLRKQVIGLVLIVLSLLTIILWRFASGPAWKQF